MITINEHPSPHTDTVTTNFFSLCTTLFIECHLHCPAATSLTHTSSSFFTYQPKPITFPESPHHLILRHTKIYGAALGSMAGCGETKENKTLSYTQRI